MSTPKLARTHIFIKGLSELDETATGAVQDEGIQVTVAGPARDSGRGEHQKGSLKTPPADGAGAKG
jgi:hypothetical protein